MIPFNPFSFFFGTPGGPFPDPFGPAPRGGRPAGPAFEEGSREHMLGRSEEGSDVPPSSRRDLDLDDEVRRSGSVWAVEPSQVNMETVI